MSHDILFVLEKDLHLRNNQNNDAFDRFINYTHKLNEMTNEQIDFNISVKDFINVIIKMSEKFPNSKLEHYITFYSYCKTLEFQNLEVELLKS